MPVLKVRPCVVVTDGEDAVLQGGLPGVLVCQRAELPAPDPAGTSRPHHLVARPQLPSALGRPGRGDLHQTDCLTGAPSTI